MVLSLAKVAIILGAGVVGHFMAAEGRLPEFSDMARGGLKVVIRQFQNNNSTPTVPKPHNDALLAQVKHLQDEIKNIVAVLPNQFTIVNASGTDGRQYVTVVIIGVGCGCLWWKGWFPDLRFATRRSLNDACTGIGNQLGNLYGSIEEAKTELNKKVIGAEEGIDSIADTAAKSQADIDAIRKKTDRIVGDLKGLQQVIERFEDTIRNFEGKQHDTNLKVGGMCKFVEILEEGSTPQNIQGPSSMPAIELPPVSPFSKAVQSGPSRLYLEQPSITPISRAESVPPTRSADPPSPSNTVESVQEISPGTSSYSRVNSIRTPTTGNMINGSSSGGFFGMNLSGMYAPLLRSRSATNAYTTNSSK